MKARYGTALSRALVEWCSLQEASLANFISRAALELYSECGSEYASLAFIVRQLDGSACVGVPRELECLPVETLLGLLVEEGGGRVACRVKDHSLDSVRFIDSQFRTSIIARVAFSETNRLGYEGAIWLGLSGAASPLHVDHAHVIAREISEWLSVHGAIVEILLEMRAKLMNHQEKLNSMRMLVHDARAPLAALKYLLADLARVDPYMRSQVGRLEGEISYVDTLLGDFAPSAERRKCFECSDVRKVVQRVCDRFSLEAAMRGCSIDATSGGSAALSVGIPELELERILSNVIGNAARYAHGGSITVHYGELDGGRFELRVSDTGLGFPQAVLDALKLDEGVGNYLSSSRGWGVGLISTKRSLMSWGGECRLSNGVTGAVVQLYLPVANLELAKLSTSQRTKSLPDQGKPPEPLLSPQGEVVEDVNRCIERRSFCLVIIDDDVEHSASLARLLMQRGIEIKSFTEVKPAVEKLLAGEVLGVICDVHMPDGGSELLLKLLASSEVEAPVAVMSGEINEDELYQLAALGASECFQKPIECERLVRWVHEISRIPSGAFQEEIAGAINEVKSRNLS